MLRKMGEGECLGAGGEGEMSVGWIRIFMEGNLCPTLKKGASRIACVEVTTLANNISKFEYKTI